MSKAHPLAGVQYRGDRQDMEEIYGKYNVAGFLEARREANRSKASSLKERMLADGVLLNEALSPRIFRILGEVKQRLEIEGAFDVICVKSDDVNAFAYLGEFEGGSEQFIGITSTTLELMDDQEIASILGHEFGHFIFGHNHLMGLINSDPKNPRQTVLPYLGECLFLRWRKKGEISCDRMGMLASGSFEASARGLVKAGFGLTGKNLNLDVDSLLAQIESIKDNPDLVQAAFRSHPLLPLRLKSLHLMAESAGAGLTREGVAAMDDHIDRLFDWFRKYPRSPLHEAVMRVVTMAGMKLLACGDSIQEEEIRTLIRILHQHFTDHPEREFLSDLPAREARLRESLAVVNREGGNDDKIFILSRLADIALADGSLMKEEAGYILDIADLLQVQSRVAYSIMIGAAQSVGFTVDYKMRELVDQVKGTMA